MYHVVCGWTLVDVSIDGGALYKLVDRSILIRAREEKRAVAAEKADKKAANAAAAETKRLATLEKGRIPPIEMFRPPNVASEVFSKWDALGIPTHDGQGNEVTKGQSKKWAKEWKMQEKAHEVYLAWKEEAKGAVGGV